jgi:hypothetical protein
VYNFGRSSPQTDLVVAFFLAVGGIVGAFLGSMAARRISDRVLSMIFAILLVAVGLKEVYDAFGGAAPQLVGTVVRTLSLRDYALISVGGVVVGIASGLTGVGGGTLIVPLLGLGFGIGQRVAQGTSLVALLPTSAIGALAATASVGRLVRRLPGGRRRADVAPPPLVCLRRRLRS